MQIIHSLQGCVEITAYVESRRLVAVIFKGAICGAICEQLNGSAI